MNNLENNDGYLCTSNEERLRIIHTFNDKGIQINRFLWNDRYHTNEFENYPMLVWHGVHLKTSDGLYDELRLMSREDFMEKVGLGNGLSVRQINKHTFI
jgi:hypothetical protein